LAQALERSAQCEELLRNRLEGWSAAFFCYGDRSGGSRCRRETERACFTELPQGVRVFADPKEGEKKMARYSKSASGDVKGAMERRKAGTLKSGKSGKTVKSKKQAIAIGLSEARAKGKKVPSKKSA
jgi:hypothetical protein